MVVRLDDEETTGEEERTYRLEKVILEGTNEGTYGEKLPFVGEWIAKAKRFVPIAQDFTAEELRGFYKTLNRKLKPFGQLLVVDRSYRTRISTVVDEDGCDEAEARGDAIKCGSYFGFESRDRTLVGRIYVGHETDRELVNSDQSMSKASAQINWAVESVKKEGIAAAADLGVILAVTRLPFPLVKLAGLAAGGGNLARKVYNRAKFDAHWTMELIPGEDAKYTKSQHDAYRDLVKALGGEV